MAKIKLGQEVQDRVSGFKGIAVGLTHYLQGCNRILVQPKVGEDGKLPESACFDEPDLTMIGEGLLPEVSKEKPEGKPPGGPRPIATKRAW